MYLVEEVSIGNVSGWGNVRQGSARRRYVWLGKCQSGKCPSGMCLVGEMSVGDVSGNRKPL